jgi:hypothetical protein
MADIFGVRVTTDLNILDTLIVICNSAGAQTHPAVAFDGQNYIVTYLDGVLDTRSGAVKVQRVSPQGTVLNNGVNLGLGDYHPDVAFDGSRCLVVWSEEFNGVMGRYVNAAGQPEGPIFEIALTQGSSTLPVIEFGAQNYLVVWFDFCPSGTDLDIYGQIVSPIGTLLGDRIVIADGAQSQISPAATFVGNGFLVIWIEDATNVFGRFITTQGIPLGTKFPVSDNTQYERQDPSVMTGAGYCLAAWNEFHTDFDLYGSLDISVGISEYHEDTPLITNQIQKYLQNGTKLYDVGGRIVSNSDVNPGIYFLEGEDKNVRKIVVVR